MQARSLMAGVALAIAGRALVPRALELKFGRDLARLNAGEHESLLAAYREDAVLRFNDGDHRWAGDWRGRAAIDAFLRNFTAARIQGTIREVTVSGPPWAMTLWVRFDDHADAADGERLYENRTVLVMRTRWGKVIEHEDFYLDTARIERLERGLRERGIEAIPRPA